MYLLISREPVHNGHDQIKNHEIDRTFGGFKREHGLFAVTREQYAISQALEELAGEFPQDLLVIGDQDGFAPSLRLALRVRSLLWATLLLIINFHLNWCCRGH